MRISQRCYAVTGLGYATPWCVNAGFVVGKGTTLVVDTGANALGAATIHGYAVAACPENRLLAINTEKHFDHIGGNSFFREQGAEIWGHADLHRTEEEFAAEIAGFNDAIGNTARRERNEGAVFFGGTSLALPDRMTATDMTFDLGDCPVEVLLTPGHTSANLSVWVPEERVLYSGDCLISGYLPNLDAGTHDDWRIWLSSLARIDSLQPAVVVPGHGQVAQGDEVGRMLETVRSVLLVAIERGYSPTSV